MSTGGWLDKTVEILTQTYTCWAQDRTLRLGAGLAYYSVFAIVPFLTLMAVVAGIFFSSTEISEFVSDFINGIVGTVSSTEAEELATKVSNYMTSGTRTSLSLIGVVSLMVAVSIIFVAFKDALDVIWHTPVSSTGFKIKKWIRKYILAYILVLLSSTFLFAGLVINAIESLAKYLMPGELPMLESLADLVFSFGTFAFGVFVVAFIFRLLINKNISWRSLLIGSALTVFFAVVGTWLLAFYLSNFASQSVGGAAGGVFSVLIWLYYEAQIVLVGAQLIKVLAIRNDGINVRGVEL